MRNPEEVRVTVYGEGTAGKTDLIRALCGEAYIDTYIATKMNMTVQAEFAGTPVVIKFKEVDSSAKRLPERGDVTLVVYDQSEAGQKETVSAYIKQLSRQGIDENILIVPTKLDAPAQTSNADIQSLGVSVTAPTSAKLGQGINSLLQAIAQQKLEQAATSSYSSMSTSSESPPASTQTSPRKNKPSFFQKMGTFFRKKKQSTSTTEPITAKKSNPAISAIGQHWVGLTEKLHDAGVMVYRKNTTNILTTVKTGLNAALASQQEQAYDKIREHCHALITDKKRSASPEIHKQVDSALTKIRHLSRNIKAEKRGPTDGEQKELQKAFKAISDTIIPPEPSHSPVSGPG